LGVHEFLRDTGRMFKLIKRPERSELMLTLRVVTLGLVVLGVVGYIFQLVGSALRAAGAFHIPREIALFALGASMAVVLGLVLYMRRRAV